MAPPSPSPWVRVTLPADALLPAVCPRCLEPGARERPLPRLGAVPEEERTSAHFCEPCAAMLDGAGTKRLAWLVAGALLGVTGATAAVLYWGARQLPLQLLLSALAGGLLPLGALALGLLGRSPEPLYLGAGRTLWAERREFASLLGTVTEGAPPPGGRAWLTPALPALLGVLWCALVHAVGTAELRVIESESDVTLLVDHAVVGRVPASLDETPRAGLRLELLSGFRHFTLIDRRGGVRAELAVAVFPGRTYLLGSPPPGRCLYLERRSYGRAHLERPARERLLDPGPLWQLSEAIDFWFVPLPPAGPEWTSGGSRTALRLLPCRAASDPRGAGASPRRRPLARLAPEGG